MSDQPKYIPIPGIAIDDDLITDPVFRTYAKLKKLAWRHDWKFTDWLTVSYLSSYLGMDRATILRHIGQLKSSKLLDWTTNGKNRYRFSIFEVRLPEVAKSPLCDPSSSGINTDTLTNIDPPLPPAKSQSCDLALILDQDAWKALRAAHICEPATTELANLPHVNATYVKVMSDQAKRDGVGIGALIHRIRQGWPAPTICDKCGGLDGDHTSACPTRPARPAGDLAAAVGVRSPRTLQMPESPEAATWRQVLDTLRLQLTTATFETWLRHTTVVSSDDGTYVIAVQNQNAQEWLDARLRPMIERALAGFIGHDAHIRFVLDREQEHHDPATLDRTQ